MGIGPFNLAGLALACAPAGWAPNGPVLATANAVQHVRVSEGCSPPCADAMLCNARNGRCEPKACGGRCDENQRCVVDAAVPVCVPEHAPGTPGDAPLR